MFCKHCGAELPEGARFCPKCGGDNKPARTLDKRTLLIAAAVLALVLLVVLLTRSCGSKPDAESERQTEVEDAAPSIVGKWTNADGVGVTFTEDGYMRFTAGNVSLGYDKFLYEVTGENTLTLTPDVPVIGTAISYDANYAIAGDTLFLGVGDYDFTLTKK